MQPDAGGELPVLAAPPGQVDQLQRSGAYRQSVQHGGGRVAHHAVGVPDPAGRGAGESVALPGVPLARRRVEPATWLLDRTRPHRGGELTRRPSFAGEHGGGPQVEVVHGDHPTTMSTAGALCADTSVDNPSCRSIVRGLRCRWVPDGRRPRPSSAVPMLGFLRERRYGRGASWIETAAAVRPRSVVATGMGIDRTYDTPMLDFAAQPPVLSNMRSINEEGS